MLPQIMKKNRKPNESACGVGHVEFDLEFTPGARIAEYAAGAKGILWPEITLRPENRRHDVLIFDRKVLGRLRNIRVNDGASSEAGL